MQQNATSLNVFDVQFESWLDSELRSRGVGLQVGCDHRQPVNESSRPTESWHTTRDTVISTDSNCVGDSFSDIQADVALQGGVSLPPDFTPRGDQTIPRSSLDHNKEYNTVRCTVPGGHNANMSGGRHKSSGGDYYKFVWNEDDDSAVLDAVVHSAPLQSPKERVAQILQETELGYSDALQYDPSKALDYNEPEYDIKGGLTFYDDPEPEPHEVHNVADLFPPWDPSFGTRHDDRSNHDDRGRGDGASHAASPIAEGDQHPGVFQVTFRKSDENLNHLKHSNQNSTRPQPQTVDPSLRSPSKSDVYQMSTGHEHHRTSGNEHHRTSGRQPTREYLWTGVNYLFSGEGDVALR